jgi:hypothetical protein
MLIAVVPLAVLVVGIAWWQWLQRTRDARALCEAIAGSPLDRDTKEILRRLAWMPRAWDSDLIRNLRWPVPFKRLAWKGVTRHAAKGNLTIYIFDAFMRPVANMPIPPVCVVVDQEGALLTWDDVAPFSEGFLRAALDEHDVLMVTTVANWFAGKGIYRYAIKDDAIVPLDKGEFVKFDNEDDAKNLPRLMRSTTPASTY